jgi:hypothetical protein
MSLPFRKLGLGGGGIKGILHIGALRELQKYQALEFPDGIYGCSIGSIIATYVSFGLPINDRLLELAKIHLSNDNIIPNLSFKNITSGITEKGVFRMDLFKENLCKMFNECGLDIKTKKISDAKMPLYIIASNITKGIPTIFTGDVLVIDALCCSCCMPGVFIPQEMYDQLYVDGDLFVPNIGSIQKDALVFSLKTHLPLKITPKTIGDITIPEFVRQVYNMSVINHIGFHKTDLTVELVYPKLFADSDLKEFDISDIMDKSESILRRFLITKGLLKEVSEINNSGSSGHFV